MKTRTNHVRHVGLILAVLGLTVATILLVSPARFAAAQANASWTYTGNLNTARTGHTSALLPSGKVLVAGGCGVGGCGPGGTLNSAELYDPATGTWSYTGNLNEGRHYLYDAQNNSATLLLNGKVLIAGGVDTDGNITSSAELYDPATGIWTRTGSLITARIYHTTTLLSNGKVLVTGGRNSVGPPEKDSAEIYDPATGRWSSTGNLHRDRAFHSATLLNNGKVLVAGGFSQNNGFFKSAELYDPGTGTWTYTGDLNNPHNSHTATLLTNGKVLLAGGHHLDAFFDRDTELYDPATGTWSMTGYLNSGRSGCDTATLLPSGEVLLVGDISYYNAELYVLAMGSWSIAANLNTKRYCHTACLLPNGKVLVAGGQGSSGEGVLNSAELYAPGTTPTPTPTATPTPTPAPAVTPTPTPSSGWSNTGNLNTARNFGHTATRLANGKVLVAGGAGSNGSLNSALLYDPSTGIWSNTGSLNTARDSHTATLLQSGKVLVAGGFSCGPPPQVCAQLNGAELYDPATGAWSSTGILNTARDSHTATLLPNGKVLVAGGFLAGDELNSVELYDQSTGTWSTIASLNTARVRHTATLLQSGRVLFAGGDNQNGALNSAELYDPATGMSSVSYLNTARELHTANLLPNGKVLVAGGFFDFASGPVNDSAELYDPATGTWTNTGTLNTARAYHTATLLAGPDGRVLVAGGFNVANGFPNIINSAELYDPATGIWTNTARLNTPRRFHTETLLFSGNVLVAGPGSSAELYYPGPNQIDDAQFFVHQHYLDFLNREPDAGGLAYWTERITQCGSDVRCIHERRIGVTAAFFIELEFQDTGYYVYRFYKASYGRQPNYNEFTADRSKVIGGSNLEASKQVFADEWVQRPVFLAAYPNTMSNTEFVNTLFDTAGLTPGIYNAQRQLELQAMNSGRSRALVLRDVIEIPDFKNIPDPNDPRYSEIKQVSQYNPAFVLMQYFGYLRRDVDQNGYDFWLDVVNNREPNNYYGMVCSFITSSEYQFRFGSFASRSNADCSQ